LEPFRIVCPSCSSKIVVRHAHLVGQTLPCPKCKGSIHVSPPSPAPPNPASPNPSIANPSVANHSVSPQAPSRPNLPTHSVPPAAINSDAITKVDPADWDLDQLPNVLPDFVPWSSEQPQQELPRSSTPGPLSNSASNSLDPAQPPPGLTAVNWQSQQAAAKRNLLLLAVIGCGGFLLAALAFGAFVRYYNKTNDRSLAQSVPVQGASLDAPTQQDAPTQEEPTPPPNELEKPSVDAPEAVPDVNATENEPDESPLSPALFPSADLTQPEAGNNPPSPPADSEESPKAASEPAIEDKLPPIFQDFQRMFDASSRTNWDDIGKADRTIESELSMENAEVLLRDEFYPPSIPVPNWHERSARVLPSVKTKPMSLLRCIDWFSKITGTGVTVDWFDMNLAGVDLRESVELSGENESLAAILQKVLEPRHLELVVDEDGFPHIRPMLEGVTRAFAEGGSLDPSASLQSIPGEHRDAIVQKLISMLELGSCTYVDQTLKWAEDAPHYEKALWMASMRSVERAMAPDAMVPKISPDPLAFGQSESWWALRQRVQTRVPLDAIVYEDRPVVDLMATAAAASDTLLVIDWPSVWSHGFHPGRMSVSVLRGRTLEEICNRYLEDYSLELIPLDSETVLLTTDAVRRSIERVIAVRLDQGMNRDDIKVALRAVVPRGPEQRSRFKLEPFPGDENIMLLRICLPTLSHFRDAELRKALGVDTP